MVFSPVGEWGASSELGVRFIAGAEGDAAAAEVDERDEEVGGVKAEGAG
jgi:hypothetical protein